MSRFWKNRSVLITGHTGFKGSWLTMMLKILGADVIGYSLKPNTNPSLYEVTNIEKECESYFGNVVDYPSLDTLIKEYKPEIIFHLAAQSLVKVSYIDPTVTFKTNVIGTVNMCELVRKNSFIHALINVTSDKCYKNLEKTVGYKEDDELGGFDPYSSSKACAEHVASAYISSFFENQYRIVSVRAGNVIGGGDWSKYRLIPDIFRSHASNEQLEIRYPMAVRPWQHVLEPLTGYIELAERVYSGDNVQGAWNFGPGDESNRKVEDVINYVMQSWCNIKYHTTGTKQDHEAGLLHLDISKAKNNLNWKPRWNFEQSLDRTIAWYDAYKQKKDMLIFSQNQINDYLYD